jgi:unsaturated rhamnogalacturonyl hydrolase
MWYQLVGLPELEGNYLETSGSAIISYAFLKASRLGLVDGKFSNAGKKAFFSIIERYLEEKDGIMSLGGICLVAGLGGKDMRDGSVEYYLSEPVVKDEAKGVAPLLLAYTEILRMKE